MNKDAMKRMAAAVKGAFDRKMIVGIVVGVTVAASAIATAQTGSTGGWFSSLFSSGGSGTSTGDTALISQQDGVVAASLNAETAECAKGADGTIGGAILAAQNVHQQLAVATPSVEQFFSPTNSCFNLNLFDLSPAIPSLASIMNAVAGAVAAYAQKKICTAVNQVTGMVTSPINQAVTTINTKGNLNNIVNKEIGSTMSGVDPLLGQQYHPTVADGSYTVNTKALFTDNQTTFSGTGSSATTTTATPAAATSSTSTSTSSSFWSTVSGLVN